MPIDEARKEYLKQYRKDYLKRVPLDLHEDLYDRVKEAAALKGMSVNGYIKSLLERETEGLAKSNAEETVEPVMKKVVEKDPLGNGYRAAVVSDFSQTRSKTERSPGLMGIIQEQAEKQKDGIF